MKVYVVIFFVMAMFVLYEYKEKIKSKGKKNYCFFFGSIACYFVYFCGTNENTKSSQSRMNTAHIPSTH